MLLYLIGILILILLLIGTILFALQYFGLFDSIQISTGNSPFEYGAQSIVYRIGYGQYNDSSQIFTEICSILPQTTTFGIYIEKDSFDDLLKNQIPEDNLTNIDYVFMVGAILPKDYKKSLQPSIMELLEKNKYHYAQLPEQVDNVVYCKFPYRGIISVVVALRKVYPAINQYIEEHRLCAYPKIEIYDKDQIYYILPLSQQNQFFQLISNGLQKMKTETSLATNNHDHADHSETINDDDEGVIGDGDTEDTENEPKESDSADSNSSYELLD